jgi:hypothetical protein
MFHSDLVYFRENIQELQNILSSEKGAQPYPTKNKKR